MVSDENLRVLQEGGAHSIAGERMRQGKEAVEAALSRAGRHKQARGTLEVKEVVVGKGEARRRQVVVRSPAEAARDREDRELTLERIARELARL
jgi:hypothetical protein